MWYHPKSARGGVASRCIVRARMPCAFACRNFILRRFSEFIRPPKITRCTESGLSNDPTITGEMDAIRTGLGAVLADQKWTWSSFDGPKVCGPSPVVAITKSGPRPVLVHQKCMEDPVQLWLTQSGHFWRTKSWPRLILCG